MSVGKKSPFKIVPIVAAAAIGAGTIGGAISAYSGSGRRRRLQQQAEGELKGRLNEFEQLDTSNVYKDFKNPFSENVFEDLTVNQKQAQFMAQQDQQQRANIMQTLAPAAGGSGIAGLAQAMANQGRLRTQQAAATIGMQEAQNQRLLAQGALQTQQGEAMAQRMRMMGASQARDLEWMKTQGLLAAATGKKESADAAILAAQERQAGVWTNLMGAGASMAGLINPNPRKISSGVVDDYGDFDNDGIPDYIDKDRPPIQIGPQLP